MAPSEGHTGAIGVDYRALFATVPGLFLLVAPDASFTILDASDAYLAATMTTRESLVGRPLFEAFPDNPDDPNATGTRNLRHSLETVIATRESHTMDVQQYDVRRPPERGGGFEERHWSPVNTPLLDADGRVQLIIHQVHDVTELVHLRAQEQKQEAELERADEMRLRFLAMASHELRTPMTAIVGFSSTLLHLDSTLLPRRRREFIEIIDSQARRLSRLIDDLLTLSRVESGQIIARSESVSVAAAIADVVRELGVEDDVVVTCPEDARVLADDDHVHQIMLNYLANARRYGRGPVRVDVQSEEASVLIAVSDCGNGVPDLLRGQLFEPFARARTNVSSDAESTGLGLSIVAGLATTHGGEAWYEDNVPMGARFLVRLPLAS